MWSQEQIEDHTKAAELLNAVKDITFDHIKSHQDISEYEVQQFILKQFEEFGLESDRDPPIVAFNENSALPHYFPKENSELLKENSLILIDLWAKLNKEGAPFADITWVAYCGEIPERVQEIFEVVIKSRDYALNFIRSEMETGKMPAGKEVDLAAREIISKSGFEGKFLHGTGHSIGFTSPHGNRSNLNTTGRQPILVNVGYTIEPGIYLKDEFGIRSEIDFYVDDRFKLIITTPIQKEIVKI